MSNIFMMIVLWWIGMLTFPKLHVHSGGGLLQLTVVEWSVSCCFHGLSIATISPNDLLNHSALLRYNSGAGGNYQQGILYSLQFHLLDCIGRHEPIIALKLKVKTSRFDGKIKLASSQRDMINDGTSLLHVCFIVFRWYRIS